MVRSRSVPVLVDLLLAIENQSHGHDALPLPGLLDPEDWILIVFHRLVDEARDILQSVDQIIVDEQLAFVANVQDYRRAGYCGFGHRWLLLRTNPQLRCVKHDLRRSGLAAVRHHHVQLILTPTDLSGIELAPQPLTFLGVSVRIGRFQPLDSGAVEFHREGVIGNPIPQMQAEIDAARTGRSDLLAHLKTRRTRGG